TFATGLRHIVRQDPDVILVGEIRDLGTAEIAIQASLTGHLVFPTLHTNDAPGAITRLQDMGVEPYLVASVLEGVLAQRLVRRICTSCRAADTPSAADLGALGIAGADGTRLYRGGGCDECRGTGYRGRTGIYELFPITEDARSLILRRAPSSSGSSATRTSRSRSRPTPTARVGFRSAARAGSARATSWPSPSSSRRSSRRPCRSIARWRFSKSWRRTRASRRSSPICR